MIIMIITLFLIPNLSFIQIRFCQELGLNKEETLSTPILSKDGTIDTVAMALRRRIFWSCVGIDKYVTIVLCKYNF